MRLVLTRSFGDMGGPGPSAVAALPSQRRRRLGRQPHSTVVVRPAGQPAGCSVFLRGQPFETVRPAGLLEIAFVALDRDHGEGLRAVEIEQQADPS